MKNTTSISSICVAAYGTLPQYRLFLFFFANAHVLQMSLPFSSRMSIITYTLLTYINNSPPFIILFYRK